VHFGVDTAVAFVATVFLGLIFGVPIVAVAIGSLVVGAIAAPYTRRAEVRALAARAAEAPPPTTEIHPPDPA
jgi:uncharacterized membrane protein YjjB (DUF3815 family)